MLTIDVKIQVEMNNDCNSSQHKSCELLPIQVCNLKRNCFTSSHNILTFLVDVTPIITISGKQINQISNKARSILCSIQHNLVHMNHVISKRGSLRFTC